MSITNPSVRLGLFAVLFALAVVTYVKYSRIMPAHVLTQLENDNADRLANLVQVDDARKPVHIDQVMHASTTNAVEAEKIIELDNAVSNESTSLAPADSTVQLPNGYNAAATSTLHICPKCDKLTCVTTQKDGRCASYLDTIQQEFRWWSLGSVKASAIRSAHTVQQKCFTTYWNGVDRIQLYFNHVHDKPNRLPRKVSNLVLADLLHELLSMVKLDAFEFVICPMDRTPAQSRAPIFTLAKSSNHKAILFPNMMRPKTIRRQQDTGSNERIAWGYDFVNQSMVPWKSKRNALFYRGSCVSLRSWGKKITDVCLGHDRGVKLPFVADVGLVGDPNSWHGKCRVITEKCHGDYVAFHKSAENKYLLILQGNGYTGRYKEFLNFDSLNFKRYDFNLYESFEFGMQSGKGGHIIDGTSMSLQEFQDSVQWAQSHDAITEKMARNAGKHVRWAMSDKTILCTVWELLKHYIKLLAYDPAKSPARSQFNKKETGHDVFKSLNAKEHGKLLNDNENLFTAYVKKLPTTDQHTQFVKMCESVLVYPELEQ